MVEVEKSKLDKMTKENHQGVVAIVPPFNYCEIEDILEFAKCKGVVADRLGPTVLEPLN